MANVQKYKRTQIGQLFSHYERKKDENGEHRKYNNQEIDLNKSYQNYNLCPYTGTSQLDRYHKRLSEVKCFKREDVKTMCSWVITLPKSFKNENENIKKRFFEASYNFLEKRYGKDNVISAFVHMDETTPHMHFAFIPVVTDKKKGHEKVSAKELLTRKELETFHQDLKSYLDKQLGRDVDVLNGATKDGNLSIKELKSRNKELYEIEKSILEKTLELNKLEAKKQNLEKLATLKTKRINKTPGFLGKVIVDEKELTNLENIAFAKNFTDKEIKAANNILTKQDTMIQNANNEADEIIRSAKQSVIDRLNSDKIDYKVKYENSERKYENLVNKLKRNGIDVDSLDVNSLGSRKKDRER